MGLFDFLKKKEAKEESSMMNVSSNIVKEEKLISSLYTRYKAGDVNSEYINELIFENEGEKNSLINEVRTHLEKLKQEDILFGLSDIISQRDEFDSYHLLTWIRFSVLETDGKISLSNPEIQNFGLQNIKSSSDFFIDRINRKIDLGRSDFENDIETTLKIIRSDIHEDHSYLRISGYFNIGQIYFNLKNNNKAEEFFNLLKTEKSSLAPSTVAEFCKEIGILYQTINDKSKALDWFNYGLTLNPKLSVKKIIKSLE